MASEQVSLRPLSAEVAARISPTRMRHFSSAPGDFRHQHSVLAKYDAELLRSRTAAPDLARQGTEPNSTAACTQHPFLSIMLWLIVQDAW